MSLENDVTLQDWIDILWQSAIQAKEKGADVRFVDMGESVGIRLYGVVVRDGRPYLNTTDDSKTVVFNSPAPTEATP
ncbi:protein of unknown function (plasmid) [Candidatus Promineifilum breve]|uniref:Uncharacterized protein n=1 Tax=Candidatus Promineifilum breve TaxID=1806508 RepID=A0A160T8K8_9CHLR|nr:hypothetical protein [Candidatus Promineifilum breve]CUS06402.1 protein of unknown function [Candidatus Promineifilum breve]